MFNRRIVLPRGGRDEGEKPFWISFADLMSALMVLFLVALTIELNKANEQREIAERSRIEAIEQKEKSEAAKEALRIERDHAELLRAKAEAAQRDLQRKQEELARTKAELEADKRKRDDTSARRLEELAEFTSLVRQAVARHEGVTLKDNGTVIDFGARAQFQLGQHTIRADQINALRQFAPDLLQAARSPVGLKWLRRIVVEGFTSSDWTYLNNLQLSLDRSQRVLCALLSESWDQANIRPDPAGTPLAPLSEQDRRDIKRLSLVGGYSSNSTKDSADASRRIELRLEFFQQEELEAKAWLPRPETREMPTGKCPI
jgi:flagellar motor protein MotB